MILDSAQFDHVKRLMERVPRFEWSLHVNATGWTISIVHDGADEVYRSPVFETVAQSVEHFNDNGQAIVERQLANILPADDIHNADTAEFTMPAA